MLLMNGAINYVNFVLKFYFLICLFFSQVTRINLAMFERSFPILLVSKPATKPVR